MNVYIIINSRFNFWFIFATCITLIHKLQNSHGTKQVNNPKLLKAKARPSTKIEIRDRTTSKFIEKHKQKLNQQSKGPFQKVILKDNALNLTSP